MGKAKKSDPFSTRSTRQPKPEVDDTIEAPPEVAEAIDAFREAQEQAKHFEGEAALHKDKVVEFCQGEYAKRLQSGHPGSFKLLGRDAMVTYVVMDSSAGLSDEDLEAFAGRWGEGAAEDLITRDFKTIRFNDKVLEAHYDAVVAALQVLPEEVLANLFRPMLMKAKPQAAEGAKKHASSPDELRELLTMLRMKHYIR